MLSGGLWSNNPKDGTGFSVSQKVANGDYDVYLWVIEDYKDYSRSMSVTLGSTTVASGIGSLPFGSWQKYGPYRTTVSNGTLTVAMLRNGKGDPTLSGMAIYSVTPNKPPAVSLTSPSTGASLIAPAAIQCTATASDPDGTIAKVEFYQGSTLVGTSTTGPYTYSWANVAAGTYSLTARATDNSGAIATSAAVSVTVKANQAPSISLSASAAAAQAPANFVFTATASDADGTIAKVELLQNGSVVQSKSSAPYSFTVSGLGAGTYNFTARATDNLGATTVSAAVSAVVTAIAAGPTFYSGVDLAGPAVTIEGNLWLSRDAAVAAGMSTDTALVSMASGTLSFSPNPAADAGTTTMLSGGVWSNNPADGTGFAVSQNVANGTYDVYLWVVEDYQDYSRSMSVTIGGTTVASGIGSLPFGSWQEYGPYRTTVANGTLSVSMLRNGKGDPSLSGIALYSVNPGSNQPPTVSLTSSTNGGLLTSPATVQFTASASDADGTIAQVELLQGGVVVQKKTTAPFTFTVSNLVVGTYSFTARATDNSGATATSAAVTVLVGLATSKQPPVVSLSGNISGLTAPATFSLNATASDPGGTVTKVELLQGSAVIQTVTASPFVFTVSNLAAGAYVFTARATDNSGLAAVSSAVNVSVTPGSGLAFDVKADFGAKADGVADDTNAIQSAVNACASGTTLIFPAGTYNIKTVYMHAGCNLVGVRSQSVLKAAASNMFYWQTDSTNSTIANLVFDMNNVASDALKFDWEMSGVVVQYNRFTGGGTMVYAPGGIAGSSTRPTSIDHNIALGIDGGVVLYYFLDNTHIDDNVFDTFYQGVSKGGFGPLGTNVTIDRNTFIRGKRCGIELFPDIGGLSIQGNWFGEWRQCDPSEPECGTSVNGFGNWLGLAQLISYASGEANVNISNNFMKCGDGMADGVEWTGQDPSVFSNNVIKTCTVTVYNNGQGTFKAMKGNIACTPYDSYKGYSNAAFWSNTDSSNQFYNTCSNPNVPADRPVPAPPFN
jgi:hypothetical protein